MARKRHPIKEIEEALQALEGLGWSVQPAKGQRSHSWGFIYAQRRRERHVAIAFFAGCRFGALRGILAVTLANFYGKPRAARLREGTMAKSMTYEFDIVVALPEGKRDHEALLDALYQAECDDAVVGSGAPGLLGLGFTRSGPEAEAVILATIAQVLRALPKGARLREVKPDLVSLADVAARLSVSRQALQKRRMPPPSLGGLFRASEVRSALARQPGRLGQALEAAEGWFAAADAAQRINARAALEP